MLDGEIPRVLFFQALTRYLLVTLFFLMFLIHRKYRNLVLLKIPYRFIADMSIYFVSTSHFLEVAFPS
jgi:hypothetical protein